MRWMLLLAIAACCHSSAPPPPAVASNTPPPPPPPADAAVPACFPAGTPLAPEEPLAGFVDGTTVRTGDYWMCDLPQRVVMVDRTHPHDHFTGEVVSLPRANPAALSRAKLSKRSTCTDRCGDDGSAGCSERDTCTMWSALADAKEMSTNYPADSPFGALALVDGASCAPLPDLGVVAVCATRTHTIFVESALCADDPDAAALEAEIYDSDTPRVDPNASEDDPQPPPDHDLIDGAPSGDATSWTFAFPGAALVFHLGVTPGATLRFDGKTEDCFAFGLSQH